MTKSYQETGRCIHYGEGGAANSELTQRLLVTGVS